MNRRPPRIFLRFFRWYCHPGLVKPIEGDLMELYEERCEKFGRRKADLLFMKDVISEPMIEDTLAWHTL